MLIDYRGPLPDKLYGRILRQTRDGIGRFKSPIDYLEDRITHTACFVGASLTRPDYYEEQEKHGRNPDFALLNKFYATVLLRHQQKKTRTPEDLQLFHDFDTKGGNQVDLFLAEFFGIE